MNYKYITIFFVVLFGISVSFISIQGNSINENLVSRWIIQEWNDDIAVAWDWPSTYFEATTGSDINYTLDYHDPTNFTYPSAGTIEIGNLTSYTNNTYIAEVLILSIYGWFPGLVTSSINWNDQQQAAQEAAQGQFTLGAVERIDIEYNYTGISRQAINFTYNQDLSLGNQNTTLIYDKKSGVLLEGYTELLFLNRYVLHLKLVYSDLISTESVTSWYFLPIFFALMTISVFWKFKKRRIRNSD